MTFAAWTRLVEAIQRVEGYSRPIAELKARITYNLATTKEG